jgi:glycosyltransferase involved in cell wall biosynthesis
VVLIYCFKSGRFAYQSLRFLLHFFKKWIKQYKVKQIQIQMRIGVAIPCYIGHINNLQILLSSIANQTRVPDKVVVSCSSTTELPIDFLKYDFDVEVICHPSVKNPSQNRNIAARHLETDIISFFDADDVMHPQRIEFIEQAFLGGVDIVLHNFETNQKQITLFESCNISYNCLCQCQSGCIRHINLNSNDFIHHAQVSVKREIFDQVQFDEGPTGIGKEDCVFCWSAFSCPNVTNAYIQNKLSLYLPSGTFGSGCYTNM